MAHRLCKVGLSSTAVLRRRNAVVLSVERSAGSGMCGCCSRAGDEVA
jgi:hypothetical protein